MSGLLLALLSPNKPKKDVIARRDTHCHVERSANSCAAAQRLVVGCGAHRDPSVYGRLNGLLDPTVILRVDQSERRSDPTTARRAFVEEAAQLLSVQYSFTPEIVRLYLDGDDRIPLAPSPALTLPMA